MPSKSDEPKLTYEQARDQLAEVVAALEAGPESLEESLQLWERGEKLVKVCQEWLDQAKQRIENVRAATQGDD